MPLPSSIYQGKDFTVHVIIIFYVFVTINFNSFSNHDQQEQQTTENNNRFNHTTTNRKTYFPGIPPYNFSFHHDTTQPSFTIGQQNFVY